MNPQRQMEDIVKASIRLVRFPKPHPSTQVESLSTKRLARHWPCLRRRGELTPTINWPSSAIYDFLHLLAATTHIRVIYKQFGCGPEKNLLFALIQLNVSYYALIWKLVLVLLHPLPLLFSILDYSLQIKRFTFLQINFSLYK